MRYAFWLRNTVLPTALRRNRFTSGLLRSNESHISLLSMAFCGQLTPILQAKKSDHHRHCGSNKVY